MYVLFWFISHSQIVCADTVVLRVTVPRKPTPAELQLIQSSVATQFKVPIDWVFVVVQDSTKRDTSITLLIGIVNPDSSGTTGVSQAGSESTAYISSIQQADSKAVAR